MTTKHKTPEDVQREKQAADFVKNWIILMGLCLVGGLVMYWIIKAIQSVGGLG